MTKGLSRAKGLAPEGDACPSRPRKTPEEESLGGPPVLPLPRPPPGSTLRTPFPSRECEFPGWTCLGQVSRN